MPGAFMRRTKFRLNLSSPMNCHDRPWGNCCGVKFEKQQKLSNRVEAGKEAL